MEIVNQDIRVRFAPSPTGKLHVGNARTALFNWLFARKNGGTFVLRIEDTDVERSSAENEAIIFDNLAWLGMSWDEGPDIGGPYGPYRQSERLEIYRQYIDRLKAAGRVYPCYCTEEELAAHRDAMLAENRNPSYSGRCRNLSDEERQAFEAGGRKPSLRFRVDPRSILYTDMIHGPIRFDADVSGDFIIVRSTGMPIYNFTVVVDDITMKITHVIRGDDHVSNTPRQLMIYDALGEAPPQFGHHGLLLGEDRKKLSKRHGATSVGQFIEKGVVPEGLMNYMALLGGGLGPDDDFIPPDQFAETFDIFRVGSSGAVFDHDKLLWMSGKHLRHATIEKLMPCIRRIHPGLAADFRLPDVLPLIAEKMDTLDLLPELAALFLEEAVPMAEDAAQWLRPEIVRELKAELETADFPVDGAKYKAIMKTVQKRTGAKGKDLFMPARAALTGRCHGPELDRLVGFLDRAVLLTRLENALELCG